jgi:hypothetical protein
MNNLGTIALAFLGGIFLVVITLATGLSLWVSWDVRRKTVALYDLLTEHQKTREKDMEEMRRVLESGRNVFQGIRAEMKTLMDAQLVEMRNTFKAFDGGLRGALTKLNGKALIEASAKMTKVMQRMEQITAALTNFFEAAGEVRGTPEEWQNPARADEHAPPNESSVSQSIYARQDVPVGSDEDAEGEFERLTENLFT